MGVNVDWMRNKIHIIYPNWMQIYQMPDNQVRAIYYSMRDKGRFRGIKKKQESYEQLTIFDFIKEN